MSALPASPPAPQAALSADQATRLRAMVESARPIRETTHLPLRDAVLASVRPAQAARTIAIASGKGGVGKTSLAVNLSIALAARGCRTTLLDADLGTANADVLCGLMPTVRLEHVVRPPLGTPTPTGERTWGSRIAQIAVDAPGGFRLVPGSAGIARMADLGPAERRQLVEALGELELSADVIVIDTAAGVGPSVLDFLLAADLALVVATPEPTAIADAYALIKCLTAAAPNAAGPLVWLAVNQAATPEEAAGVHARISAVCTRFLGRSLPYAGAVAQDLRVATAVRQRQPLLVQSPASPAARDIVGLANRMAQHLGLGPIPRSDQTLHSNRPGLFRRILGGSRGLATA